MNRRGVMLAFAASCIVSGGELRAQAPAAVTFTISGVVTGESGDALSEAEIALTSSDGRLRGTHTDSSGHFTFSGLALATGSLHVRHFGFEPKVVAVNVTRADHLQTLTIALAPAVRALNAMETTADSGFMEDPRLVAFEARAESNSFGHYVRPARLAELRPVFTSDALRGIPGVQIIPGGRLGNAVRVRGCMPFVWVDGVRAPGQELDDVTQGNDVAAIEVYSSLAGVPAQYADRRATCGTILVWLKPRD